MLGAPLFPRRPAPDSAREGRPAKRRVAAPRPATSAVGGLDGAAHASAEAVDGAAQERLGAAPVATAGPRVAEGQSRDARERSREEHRRAVVERHADLVARLVVGAPGGLARGVAAPAEGAALHAVPLEHSEAEPGPRHAVRVLDVT